MLPECVQFLLQNLAPLFCHILTKYSVRMHECVYTTAVGGVGWDWEGKYLLKWQESLFHIGTIIPGSKLRHVHGWIEKNWSFYKLVFLCSPVFLLWENQCSVYHTLNTKDFKLWKSPRERALRTHDTRFYLLFFLLVSMRRASGLDQTFKTTWSHTESILSLVCLYCFGLFFFFERNGAVHSITM